MAPRRVRSGEARTRQEERRAMVEDDDQQTRQYLLARFWEAALGFWRKGGGRTAWLLTFTVITIALVNLGLQYRLNVWYRAMFDALDKRDGSGVLYQSMIFFPLILASVSVAAAATYAKLTLQRRWRDWLNAHVLDQWLTSGRYYQLNLVPGDHSNPEYRMAEDLRLSVDAPVEFAMAVFSAVISAITFIGVLWFIGGELTIPVGSTMLRIPGFLVIAAFVYAVLASGSMVSIARGFVVVAENKNQAEAEYRYALTRLRENGESIAMLGGESEERAGREETTGRIVRKQAEDGALRLRDLSVTLNDGSAVVNEADVAISPGEKVLVVGESGTGKSTLVRAIAGLWPWGAGEILMKLEGLFLMPQQPYVPLGTLRRAATYPLSPEAVDDAVVRKTVEEVGLGHFLDRLDEDTRWEHMLSGGEKQRLAFARVLIHRPNIIVMDEATAALDSLSQEQLMRLLLERLPEATIVSVGHRAELEAFHTRKLVLEYRPEGARLVGDESLQRTFGRSARLLSRLRTREKSPKVPNAARGAGRNGGM